MLKNSPGGSRKFLKASGAGSRRVTVMIPAAQRQQGTAGIEVNAEVLLKHLIWE